MRDVTVTLNGKPRECPDVLSLLDLLKQLDVQPSRVVVEHNREIRRRDDCEKTQGHAGDELQLVYFVGGGSSADDALVVGGRSLRSRLIQGTGKFASNEVLARCLEAAQPDMITVAIRRLNLEGGRSELEGIDLRRFTLLPNTAGATTAEGAVRLARLARAPAFSRTSSRWKVSATKTRCFRSRSRPSSRPASWSRKASS